ncbi:arginine deiminase [Streptococcus pneumoniae]
MSSHPIQVFSEIGKLKKVMLHRPGKELENLLPDYLERLLFDDIPFLEDAQKEHDAFAQALRDEGIEVLYLEQLAAESLTSPEIRDQFIEEYLDEANIRDRQTKVAIRELLHGIKDNQELVEKTMAGIQKVELPEIPDEAKDLTDLVESDYPFAIDPMPNLYFTRDPFATIGNAVSLNHMFADTRNRETLYGKYIFKYHPIYGGKVDLVYNREEDTRIEGGDELILSKDVLAVGISQRTDAASIEKLLVNIFKKNVGFKKVLAFEFANNRKFMHLDTVFTMVDYDKFTIHPEIEGDLHVYSVTYENEKLKIVEEKGDLAELLAQNLGVEKVHLIRCGGGNIVAAAREQWNDGSNTLMVLSFIPWTDLGVTIFDDFNAWLTGLPVIGNIVGSSTSALGTWYFPEGAMLFAFMGILIGVIYGLKEDKIISSFMNGAADLLSVALIVAIARGIQVIMNDGMITDTILNWGKEGLSGLSSQVFIVVTYIFYLPMSFLIPSSSGLASATMGIMAPLGEFVNVRPSLIITAYQSASGVLNLIAPTSGIVMGALALGRINIGTWWKFMGKLVVAIIVVTIALLLLGTFLPFL